jgi:hypothetical protein
LLEKVEGRITSRFGDAMKVAAVSLVAACVALLIGTAVAAESPPRWAYPENNPNYKLPLDDGNLVRVPDSTAGYSRHGSTVS